VHNQLLLKHIFESLIISGMFLCICGVQDGNFGNQNKGGSFHNLDARLQNFNKTKTWSSGFDNGNIAVSKLSEYVIYATNKLVSNFLKK